MNIFTNCTLEQAKEKGFTHHAKFYGVQGYVKLEDNILEESGFQFEACTKMGKYISDSCMYLDIWFEINDGFPILLGPEL